MDISLRGNGEHENLKGNIVGFSNRLNTILVPQSFMEWANAKFSSKAEANPSRLIIEVTNPADAAVVKYFQDNGYETEDGKLDNGKTAYFLRMIITIVLCIGLLICILSFYILILSIYLLVQKNTSKFENLLLIGYTPFQVALPYQLMSICLNIFILALSFLIISLLRNVYYIEISSIFPQLQLNTPYLTYAIGGGLVICVSILNALIVRNKINSIRKS